MRLATLKFAQRSASDASRHMVLSGKLPPTMPNGH